MNYRMKLNYRLNFKIKIINNALCFPTSPIGVGEQALGTDGHEDGKHHSACHVCLVVVVFIQFTALTTRRHDDIKK